MKNLKLFVFALCAVLLSVVTVNAASTQTCNLPGQTGYDVACIVKVTFADGTVTGYTNATNAYLDLEKVGGTLEVLGNNTFTIANAHTVAKDTKIVSNGNKVTFNNAITVAKGATLTIENTNLDVKKTMVVMGSLALNNVKATVSENYVSNEGTTTVNGGEITASSNGYSVFVNLGTLTLNNVTRAEGKLYLVATANGSNTTINGGTYDVNALFNAPTVDPATANPRKGVAAGTVANFTINSGDIYTNQGSNVDHNMNVVFNNGTYTVDTNYALNLVNGTLTVNGGKVVASSGDGIQVTATNSAKLNITGGTVESTKNGCALNLASVKATYAISGGVFDSKHDAKQPAINLTAATKNSDGKVVVADAYKGILTGGKYLNNIIAGVVVNTGTYDVADQLVAKDYTVKTEAPYKVVVSTKASEETNKPGAKPGEEAPNTFDAGLVYMGLALSAIGASVVSVRKLRNN